ncbi:Homeodomain-interacting protein kinase 2 [Dissostichus eleginoides]|uniref:Homeodomain-interacting protein kinase 2 n=1 Tax=Dissostichus eleginoides TaxID=100907 RepID=A0AAD9F3M2_DISEL|nr:Homeodomain-interacting protein kinase 2 [Dissostichus eleginoides]
MCMDNVTNTKKAVKISKDRPLFFERALEEIKILQKLQTLDADKCSLVKWYGSFYHEKLICLEFELLDLSLYEYMLQRKHNALPIAEIRPVLRQLTTALLHLEALEIIHADIKPENIMVVNRWQHPLQVKLIDFGLARHVSEAVPGTAVQSLWYRAPEVLMGMDFSEQIDMWSLGAVAAEIAAGFALFPADHEYDALKLIVDLTPWEFAVQTGHHFRGNPFFYLRSLDDLVEVIPYRHMAKREELLNFVDLLKKMLVPDKCGRIIPLTVLEHPFFAVEQDPEVSQSIETVIVDMRDSEPSVTLQLSKNDQSVAFKAVTLPEQLVSAQPETVYFKLEDEAAHMEPEVIKVTSGKRKSGVRRFLKSIRNASETLSCVRCDSN